MAETKEELRQRIENLESELEDIYERIASILGIEESSDLAEENIEED